MLWIPCDTQQLNEKFSQLYYIIESHKPLTDRGYFQWSKTGSNHQNLIHSINGYNGNLRGLSQANSLFHVRQNIRRQPTARILFWEERKTKIKMLRWISVVSSLWWSNFGMHIVVVVIVFFSIDLKALNFSLVMCIRKFAIIIFSFFFASSPSTYVFRWLCIYYYFRLQWYSWWMSEEKERKRWMIIAKQKVCHMRAKVTLCSQWKENWMTNRAEMKPERILKMRKKLFHSILWAIRYMNQGSKALCWTLRPLPSSYYYYYYFYIQTNMHKISVAAESNSTKNMKSLFCTEQLIK